MHFCFHPNHEYACPHVGDCPHLGGAALGLLVRAADYSTEWLNSLLRQIDNLRAQNEAKSRKIDELSGRNEQLERELKAERQKQFQRKPEEPATEDPESASPESKKRRGAPMGHPGWYRPRPTAADRLDLETGPRNGDAASFRSLNCQY